MATRQSLPLSLLDTPTLSSEQWIGGLLAVLLAHAGLPIAIIAVMKMLTAGEAKPTRYIDEEHVIEARFVRKGVKKDPNQLPDRIVPKKSTAPDDSTVVSKNMNPEKPDEPKPKPPENATLDDLTRIGDRVQDFAEISDKELEGDPNGVEDGTETEAQPGDIYIGQLVEFFKRGWTIPSTLGDTSKLIVTATFEITTALKVGPSEIVKPSGEPLFDQSVEDRFEQLRSLGSTLPEPPPEVADRFIGKEITVRFKGARTP